MTLHLEPNLKLITGYFCQEKTSEYDRRFKWAFDETWEFFDDDDKSIYEKLIQVLQYLTADPSIAGYDISPTMFFEDLVKEACKVNDKEALDLIRNNDALMFYLEIMREIPSCVPFVEQINSMTRSKVPEKITFDWKLKILSPKECVGFWVSSMYPRLWNGYRSYSHLIDAKLASVTDTIATVEDLATSAPDSYAMEIVSSIVTESYAHSGLSDEQLSQIDCYLLVEDKEQARLNRMRKVDFRKPLPDFVNNPEFVVKPVD